MNPNILMLIIFWTVLAVGIAVIFAIYWPLTIPPPKRPTRLDTQRPRRRRRKPRKDSIA